MDAIWKNIDPRLYEWFISIGIDEQAQFLIDRSGTNSKVDRRT
jgi:hypothetical protein